MGRDKILLKKVENKTYRHISFSKRKNGLVKKAYELSTVCDEDVGLLIFSPAGKLVLFDGKRRIEETLKRYIDLPHHQRTCDMDNKTVDSQVEGIQDEISPRNVELEDVKKQLEVFVKCTKCIKSITSVEYYERMLEDTIKRVSLHKTLHPQTASASNVMMGSLNYDLEWPQQHDATQFLTNNFASSTGFQPFRNESDPFAEVFPSSMAFNGAVYSVGNAACGDYVPLQSSIAFNAAGCLYDNAVSSGSDQLAPSMEFSNTEYLAENEVSGGSHKLDYGFFYPQRMDYSGDCRAKPSVGDVAVMAALHHSMTFQKSLFHFTLQAPNQFNLFTCSYITQIGD
ncbi:hypothetical protein JRO89_XS08G0234700 [Xanthoceras sorbifolium]|uniref:MADS-box domain-containing protein n=1 Tax=Xanthoceras sorbifolium TaxID=99658 RepID=A0ABQ8HR18_9ROSI|nr:hypothetical protein JRO89_XS08G0234700 [Xanthoceras sorbifolium]